MESGAAIASQLSPKYNTWQNELFGLRLSNHDARSSAHCMFGNAHDVGSSTHLATTVCDA